MKKSKGDNTGKVIIKTIKLMQNQLVLYGASLIIMAMFYSLIMDVFLNVIYQKLLDAAFTFQLTEIKKYALQLVIVLLASCFICPFLSFVIHYSIQKTMARVRVMVFKKAVNFPMQYYEKTHSKDIISCLNNDLQLLEDFYFWPMFLIFLAVMEGIGSAALLFVYSPIVALVAISTAGITLFINKFYAKKMKVITNRIQELQAKMAGVTIDELGSFRVSRIFSIREFLMRKFLNYNEEHFQCKNHYGKNQAQLDVCNNTLNYIGYILVCILSLYFVFTKDLTIGKAIACMQLRGGIEYMISSIGSIIGQIQYCSSGSERVFQLLDSTEESMQFDNMSGKELSDKDLIIKFDNVSFSYDEKDELLHNLNFEIRRGMKVGFVGHSGCGKSTISKMLLGFYPAKSGAIYFNGKTLSHYSKEEIRDFISYVPQEPYLFGDTIKANIGVNNESEEDIINAAKAAYIHDVIMELPDQYDTVIGENGANLSGGQKQRIAIARAFLKKSDVIIFDESTSALERELESKIMESIVKYSKNQTVIFITHRRETLEEMDKIYLIESGSLNCFEKTEYLNRSQVYV